MARLPRLVVPGLAHYVVLRGHNGGRIALDASDREAFVRALRESMDVADVAVHALAVLGGEAHLLLRPRVDGALARLIQTLGRRYVAGFNQRHGRSGTLWDGRYRAALVEPGESVLFALRCIERLRAEADGEQVLGPAAVEAAVAPHSETLRKALLTAPAEVWALGNTPFEREAAYRQLLADELAPARVAALEAAVRSGRVFGALEFVAAMAREHQRPLAPARRGRPSRQHAAVR
jgi:putative transposase